MVYQDECTSFPHLPDLTVRNYLPSLNYYTVLFSALIIYNRAWQPASLSARTLNFYIVLFPTSIMIYNRAWQPASIQCQIANILVFPGHVVSVVTTQLCHCSAIAAIPNMQTNVWLCSNKTLFLKKCRQIGLGSWPWWFWFILMPWAVII